MTTKREAEIVEGIVCDMSAREYMDFVFWLSHGAEGSLWDCIRRPKRQRDEGLGPDESIRRTT
jgi:hypothetical protein